MEEKTPNLQLQEPVLPESLVPATDHTLLWIGLGVLAFLILIYVLMRKQRKAAKSPTNLRAQAYARAKKALDSLIPANARDAAVQVSLIIRRFLADAVGDPSLFQTHEEFISRQDSLRKLKPEASAACSAGFARLARLKYAPEIPDEDPATVVADARKLLETLNGGFEA